MGMNTLHTPTRALRQHLGLFSVLVLVSSLWMACEASSTAASDTTGGEGGDTESDAWVDAGADAVTDAGTDAMTDMGTDAEKEDGASADSGPPPEPGVCANLTNAHALGARLADGGEPSFGACLLDPACAQPMITAHRGFTKIMPENSLGAINAAFDLGVDIVELDVRHTADDQLVLMHDETVDRTTPGSGIVEQMTLAELTALTLYNPRTEEDFPDQRVPSFAEAAEACRGRLLIDLDMKTDRMDLVAAAFAALDLYDFVLPRGKTPKLEALYELDSGVRVMPDLYAMDDLADLVASLDPFLIELHLPSPTAADVDALHQAGLRVWMNALQVPDLTAMLSCDPETWEALIDLGPDVIQTDYPEILGPIFKGME